jgi:DNA-binding NarL/FixJ family response regulator
VRTHQHERAEETLRAYAELVARTERTWGQAAVARCRGLIEAEHAIDGPFLRALASHVPGVLPFEEARTRLLYGERLRRARRRIDAREQLLGALATFERLGAPLWARRAREEFAATGAPARRSRWASGGALTSQELRVARLVAQGATNREAAAALFLLTKTVEAHLRHAFRKLGVRSRTELAALAARGELERAPEP